MKLLNDRNWPGLGVLAMLTVATSALLFFIKVSDEVIEGDTRKFDSMILMWLRARGNPTDPVGPRWVEDVARDITALGSPVVLGLFVLIAAIFLALAGKRQLSIFMLISTCCGTITVTILKGVFDRPRPLLIPDNVFVHLTSFPSGHATMSAVVYLTLGALITRLVNRTILKLYIISIAIILSGLIGLSRIYLGVHWPSDVLAGWAFGAAWALGGGVLAQIIHLDKDNTT